jgi:hypothetical protein
MAATLASMSTKLMSTGCAFQADAAFRARELHEVIGRAPG